MLSLSIVFFTQNFRVSSFLRSFDTSSAQSAPCTSATLNAIGARSGASFTTEVGCMQSGTQIYLNDSQYTFFQAPSSLASKGVAYIKTPNSEVMNSPLNWSVNITTPSDVYIFYRKIPGILPPNWITSSYIKQTPESFSDLAPFLLRKNSNGLIGVYDVYKLQTLNKVGVLDLHDAIPSNNITAYSMYIVGVVPNNPNNTTNPTASVTPTTTARPTSAPTTPTHTEPPVSGDFPCGKYPNANPGCMPVSFQSWFDNVPASAETMNVNYTPRLVHQHYECNVPAVRANGQYLKQGMKIVCQFVRYNSIIPFNSGNSSWFRSQNQGSTYEQFTMNLAPCQGNKYEGKECKSENVHTVRASDFSSATEMRYTPNTNFAGMGGQRHFLSSNWQTGIGYRSSSEFTSRYWIGECGNYQRMILSTVDKYMRGNEPIATVRGTITLPFESNGGCGTQFKTFVFLDPAQHVTVAGTQTGTTLFESNSHVKTNLTWDTTKTTNGLHSLLFINMEGTGKYVSASGVAVKYIVQN